MERGQSTIEVAIAFPVLVIMLWWTIVPPVTGVRALAARLAITTGARRAALEDRPDADRLGQQVQRWWERLGGAGGGKQVGIALTSEWVTASARDTAPGPGRVDSFQFRRWRERD